MCAQVPCGNTGRIWRKPQNHGNSREIKIFLSCITVIWKGRIEPEFRSDQRVYLCRNAQGIICCCATLEKSCSSSRRTSRKNVVATECRPVYYIVGNEIITSTPEASRKIYTSKALLLEREEWGGNISYTNSCSWLSFFFSFPAKVAGFWNVSYTKYIGSIMVPGWDKQMAYGRISKW